MYDEAEYLLLSGLQHFIFCRRQWALIHLEGLWAENARTVEGELFHGRVHNETIRETRSDSITVRGLRISSAILGINGQCDVIEFRKSNQGISLSGHDGLWTPYPIEYKRGEPKNIDADRFQLCGQALCLEEMLCCDIPKGALFYGQIRRREEVAFTKEMRNQVKKSIAEMHEYAKKENTPKSKITKSCEACSLKELCMPEVLLYRSVEEYIATAVQEDP